MASEVNPQRVFDTIAKILSARENVIITAHVYKKDGLEKRNNKEVQNKESA